MSNVRHQHHQADALEGVTVLERGWLSSNNVLLAGQGPAQAGCTLVDAGHVKHAAQTVALVAHALAGRPLQRLCNTHLHSDHCGGNAALARAHGMPVAVPASQAEAVAAWAQEGLSYQATGQQCERFSVLHTLSPGDEFEAAGRCWRWLGAPGHDPHSLMLFDAERGVLLSADALWQHGFGVVFPELVNEPGFDDVAAVLEAIAALPVKLVVPGHGAPFDDVRGALQRARARLAGMRAEPGRHARHGAKVLIKYHLMEVGGESEAALLDWAAATPLLREVAQCHGPGAAAVRAWAAELLQELLTQGALRRPRLGWIEDA